MGGIRGLGPSYLNGMRAPGVNPGVWLSLSEEEFAAQLREHGWSQHAIDDELETLRAYTAQFAPARVAPTKEIPEERAEESQGLKAVLDMRRKKALLKRKSLQDEDDGD